MNAGNGDNGNVISILNCRDTTRTQSFTYDALNRITSGQSSGSQWGENFLIDPWGNLYGRTPISGKTNYEPLNLGTDAQAITVQNQLSSANGFTYDPAGNLTINNGTTFTYDAENQLVFVNGYRYIYDADGERVEKCQAANATAACPTTGTTGTLYWRSTGGDTLDESDLAGNAVEEYVYFGGRRIARRDVSTNAVHYYFSDHLGTHAVVSDATGTKLEQDIDYYPYGGFEHDYCTSCVAQNYKFNGKERDTESGLDNFGARFDASFLGRFMTADWSAKPIAVPYAHYGNPQSLNLYSYGQNNPTTFGDPDGHTPVGCALADQRQCANKGKVADDNAKGQNKEAAQAQKEKEQAQNKPDVAEKVIKVFNRATSAVTGALNGALGIIKIHTAIATAALAPETGPGAGVAAATATYLTINGTGQTMSGVADLTYAATGKEEAKDASEVLTGATTISGAATLALTGGNFKAAATVGSIENMVPALAGGNPSPEKAMEFFSGLIETGSHLLNAGSSPSQQKAPDPESPPQ